MKIFQSNSKPGWYERKVRLRPKTRIFSVLSVGWFLISPSPAALLFSHQLRSTSLPGIICWLLVALHPVFIALAIYFRVTEQPKIIKQTIPNPNYDLRHLD